MIKALMTWTLISSTITSNLILTNVHNYNLKSDVKSKDDSYVNHLVTVNHNYQSPYKSQSGEDDLFIKGVNNDTHYRMYIDSSKDNSLPTSPVSKTEDYVVAKANKREWYNHLIPGLSINVTNYADSKSQFLNKYKAISFSYVYNYNFWNSRDGWSHNFGKSTPLVTAVKTYPLLGDNSETLIFEESESSHANNEKAKLVLKREWDGNVLKYNFYLSVLINWKNASPHQHASFASLTRHNFTFISVPPTEFGKPIKTISLDHASKFTLDASSMIDLKELDSKLKTKANEEDISQSRYKTVSNFIFGYYGVKQFNQKNYVLSIHVMFLGYPAIDSSLILNGINRLRTLQEIFSYEGVGFDYSNSIGQKVNTSKSKIGEFYLNTELTGTIYAPILYTI